MSTATIYPPSSQTIGIAQPIKLPNAVRNFQRLKNQSTSNLVAAAQAQQHSIPAGARKAHGVSAPSLRLTASSSNLAPSVSTPPAIPTTTFATYEQAHNEYSGAFQVSPRMAVGYTSTYTPEGLQQPGEGVGNNLREPTIAATVEQHTAQVQFPPEEGANVKSETKEEKEKRRAERRAKREAKEKKRSERAKKRQINLENPSSTDMLQSTSTHSAPSQPQADYRSFHQNHVPDSQSVDMPANYAAEGHPHQTVTHKPEETIEIKSTSHHKERKSHKRDKSKQSTTGSEASHVSAATAIGFGQPPTISNGSSRQPQPSWPVSQVRAKRHASNNQPQSSHLSHSPHPVPEDSYSRANMSYEPQHGGRTKKIPGPSPAGHSFTTHGSHGYLPVSQNDTVTTAYSHDYGHMQEPASIPKETRYVGLSGPHPTPNTQLAQPNEDSDSCWGWCLRFYGCGSSEEEEPQRMSKKEERSERGKETYEDEDDGCVVM